MNRIRRLLLWTAVLSSSATALALAPEAGAEANYSCESCYHVSGPNQNMNYLEGINYSFAEVYGRMWKYNGGSNYSVVWEAVGSGKTVTHCTGPEHVFNGHGETWIVEGVNGKARLAGHEANGGTGCTP